MKGPRALSLVLCCLAVVTMAVAPCICDSVDASEGVLVTVDGVTVHSFSNTIELNANDSTTMRVSVHNDSSVTKEILLTYSISPSKEMHLSPDPSPMSLISGGASDRLTTVKAGKYAATGQYSLTISISVTDIATGVESTGSMEITAVVSSVYSAGSSFNKILGVFANPFPDPFNGPVTSTLVTAAIWFTLGALMSYLIVRILISHLLKIADRKDKMNEKDLKSLRRNMLTLMLICCITNCLRVYGADEIVTATFSDITALITVAILGHMGWKVYKVIVHSIIVTRDTEDVIDDSIEPLFKMIGKIVIAVLVISSMMTILGLDFAAIVTSAGLVSLAISFGAQSTLNQFFSGLVLLSVRPFRIGDKVRLGTSQDVLIVRKITVMETEFKSWLNEEIIRMPNSTVMSSSIVNITREDKSYKVYEYFDISYDADMNKAREIIMAVVNGHPKVILDGSKDMPSFRFYSMESSSVRLRVTYVVGDHEIAGIVAGQIREGVFRKFKAEGIKIPYNQIDVHVRE